MPPATTAPSGRERHNHGEELRKAARVLTDAIPGLTVEGYFVDFDGIWATEVAVPALAGA